MDCDGGHDAGRKSVGHSPPRSHRTEWALWELAGRLTLLPSERINAMALTTKNLLNGGQTAHYAFQYDDSLASGPEPARTNGVIAACEGDFTLMTNWFRGTHLDVDFRIPVNVTQNGGGASWNLSGRNLTVTINPASGGASIVRYLLVSE